MVLPDLFGLSVDAPVRRAGLAAVSHVAQSVSIDGFREGADQTSRVNWRIAMSNLGVLAIVTLWSLLAIGTLAYLIIC
jgi:hypothetical protein